MAIAGVAAWFLARLIGVIVVGNSSVMDGIDHASRFDETPSFPVVRLAVIVAVIAVASPYLTRPTRRIGQLLILLLALAALYLGTGLPDAAFAAVVLGWGIAAIVHLVFGSPGGRPTTAQVAAALHELTGFDGPVTLAPKQPRYGTIMTSESERRAAVDPGARPRRSRRAAPRQGRAVGALQGRRPEPAPHPPRRGRARGVRDAARGAGRGPRAARRRGRDRRAERGAARHPPGRRDRARATSIPPRSPTRCSTTSGPRCARLHGARVAHGALNARHVVLGQDGAAIVGFERAAGSATGSPARPPTSPSCS